MPVSFKMPEIRPELLAKWQEFKKEQLSDRDRKLFADYRDHNASVQMPRPGVNTRHFATRLKAPEPLDWVSTDRNEAQETAQWTDGVFYYEAKKVQDDDADMSWRGRFTDKPRNKDMTRKT